jgi:hypothetical protein
MLTRDKADRSDWGEEELGDVELGDVRLTSRWVGRVQSLARTPDARYVVAPSVAEMA